MRDVLEISTEHPIFCSLWPLSSGSGHDSGHRTERFSWEERGREGGLMSRVQCTEGEKVDTTRSWPVDRCE